MKAVVVALAVILAACTQEKSEVVGDWVSETTGSRLAISDDMDCRYYPGGGRSGLKCEIDRVTAKTARITFSSRGAFADGNLSVIAGKLYSSAPSIGMDTFIRE